MKKIFLSLVFYIWSQHAFAQSTAGQAYPVILTTSGCPAGLQSCYVPVTTSNPIPVVSK